MGQAIDITVSKKLRNMAALCAMMVCFIHVGLLRGDEISVSTLWFHRIFTASVCKIAVPFFFLAAGYFIAGHMDEDDWWRREVSKRIKTLLVPLLIWNFLMFIWNVGYDWLANLLRYHVSEINLGDDAFDICLRLLGLQLFKQPYHGVLWFLRALFVLCVLSPFFKRIAYWPVVLLLYLAYGVNYPDYVGEMSPRQFFFHEGPISVFGATYFLFGICLRLKKINLIMSRDKGLACLAGGIALVIIKWFLALKGMLPLTAVVGWLSIPLLLCAVWWLCPSNLVFSGSTYSFAVYILHVFWLSAIGRCNRIIGFNMFPIQGLANYLFMSLVIYVTSWMSAIAIQKIAPRFYNLLFGARG